MKATLTSFFATICLCFAINAHLNAQTEDIITRHYSMKEGLSHGSVKCLIQDSQGFLWVGTLSGLNKFDGYQFTTYRENPSDANSLTNHWIKCLWEDRQQRLWIGTIKGLELFDLTTEKFYDPLPDSLNPIKEVHVQKIRERRDGKVWVCTYQGVYLANPQTLAMKKFLHFPEEVTGNIFLDIAEAKDGSVWAASKNGLVHMNAHTGRTTRYWHDPEDPNSLGNNNVLTVYVDSHDRVWAMTVHSLDLFNPEDESFTHFLPEHLQSIQPLNQSYDALDLLEHPDGKFWVASDNGLFTFNPETGKFDLLMDQEIGSIRSILQDRQGSIWVAGSGTGLCQIAPQSKKFNRYRQFGQPERFNHGRVYIEDANHYIWFTLGNSLFRFDPSTKRYYEYQHDSDNPLSYSGTNILSIMPDQAGGVWLASDSQLEKFNPQNQTFTSYAIPVEPWAIFKDSEGRIWIGEVDGAGIFDPQTGTYERLVSLPRTWIHTISEDKEKNLWMGPVNIGGLFRYSLKTGQLDAFKHNPADPHSLSNNRIYHLMKDQEDAIWIGTGGGLNKLIPGTESGEPKFIHWQTTNSDLPNDDVWYIIDGGDETLWLTCDNRVSHFIPHTGVFRNYDHHDGLSGRAIGWGVRAHNGEIYFGSNGGLISFHPDSLQNNSYIPPVVLTSFSIQNQPVPVRGSYGDTLAWASPITQSISYTDEVEFTYKQNDFAFEFAALNFVNPDNNLYKYKLEPYETEWIETTTSNRIARYTNLDPGHYTFRVIGSNNDELWNEEGKSLSIIIHPPWWQTWWAYALYGLLALSVLLYIRQYEIKRVRLRQRATHLSEMDTFKSRFYTNITHEFRTPLTVILGIADQIGEKAKDVKSMTKLIKRNGFNLLQLVNQMLDLSKLEAGMLTVTLQQGNIIPYIRYIVESFHSLAEHKDIHIHFRTEISELMMDYDADKVLNIVSNLLSNAIKFTPEEGHVSLVVSRENERFYLRIMDTGMGIPANQLPHIFDRFYQGDTSITRKGEGTGIGLSLTKELIQLLRGSIYVKSTVWQGTEFTVELPITNTAPLGERAKQSVFEIAGDYDDNPNDLLPPTDEKRSQPVALIVEDNVDVVYYLRTCLQGKYTLEVAQNGQDGIDIALEKIPDIIISDVMMPEKNGYELCETLKNNVKTSHIPIILLTAKAAEADKIEGLTVGADAYLTKPFNKEELKLRIRNLITHRKKLWGQYKDSFAYKPQELEVSSHDQQFLTKALELLETHKSDPDFSAENLQKELGVSRTLLHVKLKALTGQSTTEFIRTYRLKYAAQLIQQHFGNIAQVAYEAGFNDQSYFTKSFKKHFGVAPSEYAKKAYH